MAQPPPQYHAFADPQVVLNTLSDLAIAGLLDNMSSGIRTFKPPHARVAHACDYCRRLKTKCSGQQPECASCKKRGRVCQWTPLKTSKCRRSRKPYDAWIPYNPPIAPKAHERARVSTPRPAYSSVMLPRSMDGTLISIAQAASMTTAPMVETVVQQSLTVCSTPMHYGWEGLDIHTQWMSSPPPSSSRSDSSSCDSVLPLTPLIPQETPTSSYVGPPFSPLQDVSQMPSDADMEAFFHELYQHVSPKWSPPGSDEFEMLFAP